MFWNGARRRVMERKGGERGGKKGRKKRMKPERFSSLPVTKKRGCFDSYLIVDVSPWTGHANTFQESGSSKFSHFLPTRADTFSPSCSIWMTTGWIFDSLREKSKSIFRLLSNGFLLGWWMGSLFEIEIRNDYIRNRERSFENFFIVL